MTPFPWSLSKSAASRLAPEQTRRPKRPDSVDVAAQLILGDGGDKAFDEQDYDEEALHRAHDLIYAAEIDKKATGGVVAA